MSENRDHARMGMIGRMRKKSGHTPRFDAENRRKRRVHRTIGSRLPCGRIPFIFAAAVMFFSAGCRVKTTDNAGAVFDHVQQAESGDETLAAIAAKARDSLPVFFERLQKPAKDESHFMVKCPFPAEAGSGFEKEYLWLKDIRFKDGVYTGIVASRPFYAKDLEAGSAAVFNLDDVADWMYLRNGKIEGGLSIRHFIEKIPELDRDNEMNSIFELFE